ncbi:hypothetical protein PROFUN_03453 [Planoprotostelium fungivorum]|uniref:glutathione transferase n=1 Tax=Planoprotostelium fungivorum TaxID=1890364 RepID=A0A2P6MN59_9EUKA|nr:hypothetical protein PROFUN_03453 [Planoprotostelium fungivorum]
MNLTFKIITNRNQNRTTTMTIQIKGLYMSTCARRGFTVAEELGVAYELVPVDFAKGEHKSPEYREKYQPFGQIPVLIDGDFQVFESRAISRYIADAHGKADNTLYPKDAKKRALVEQWISVEQSHFNCVDAIVGQLLFAPMFGGQPNQQIVADNDVKFKTTMAILDKHLSTHKYFAGEDFTLADVVYLPYTDYLLKTKEYSNSLDNYPNFKAWWERCSSRPSWQKNSLLFFFVSRSGSRCIIDARGKYMLVIKPRVKILIVDDCDVTIIFLA